MRLLAIAVFVALLTAPAAAEPAENETEALRKRLLDAYQSQDRIHHAICVSGVGKTGAQMRLFAELFIDGEIGGGRLTFTQGEESLSWLMATDGRILVAPAQGALQALEGVETMRKVCAPYDAVRHQWRERWGRPVPATKTWGLAVRMGWYEDDNTFGMGISVETDPEPKWLEEDYFSGKDVVADEETGVVKVIGPSVDATYRLNDGLPVALTIRAEGERGELAGGTVPPEWSADRWREEIQELCAGYTLGDVTLSLRRMGRRTSALLRAAVSYGDDLIAATSDEDPRAAELGRVLDEILAVELKEHPPNVALGEEALAYTKRRLREVKPLLRETFRVKEWDSDATQYFCKQLAVRMTRHAVAAGAVYVPDSDESASSER